MKNILVTGGAGFIGSNLCEFLLNKGNAVICLDNLSSGSMENIRHLMKNPSFRFVEHDVTKPYTFDVDAIYNLACPASPVHYSKNPIHTVKTCFEGMLHALELARKMNCPVLQSSTSEIYGNPLVHPQVESYFGNVNPIGPRSCYDEGKRVAETLCFDYQKQYDVDIRVIRIFNTYGPRMLSDDGRVVSNFIVQALNDLPITIYGDGSQTRSFCYVDDLIRGATTFMSMEKGFHGPVNLGNPGEFTIAELAEMVVRMTNSKSEIVYMPLPQDDPCRRKPDISVAKQKLNWEPTIPLAVGLEKTIAYFKGKESKK